MAPAAVEIRDASPADAAAIAALHAASWRVSYRSALPDDYLDGPMADEKLTYWRDKLATPSEGQVVLCALEPTDGLLGFTAAWTDPDLSQGVYLDNLHADPRATGRGVGRALLAAMARRLASIGVRQLWLIVFADNVGAIRLYDRLEGRRGLVRAKTFGGAEVETIDFLWDDLPALAARAEAGARGESPRPPVAIRSEEVATVEGASHPVASAERASDRVKRRLGDVFGLDQYGVNRVDLAPGVWSTVRHWHSHEDEFVYVLSGALTLVTDRGETTLGPGDCAGFKAGVADGHRLENRSDEPASYLEVGSRRPDVDETIYPDEDLLVRRDGSGRQMFMRRDGTVVKPAD